MVKTMNLDGFQNLLVEKSYKVTNQRILIFEILYNNQDQHLSPEEIHNIVIEKDKDIGIATVYRTLLLFEKLDIVNKTEFDDKVARYELLDENDQHHHLICTNCNKIIEVDGGLLTEVETQIEEIYDFTIVDHDLKFFGICGQCQ